MAAARPLGNTPPGYVRLLGDGRFFERPLQRRQKLQAYETLRIGVGIRRIIERDLRLFLGGDPLDLLVDDRALFRIALLGALLDQFVHFWIVVGSIVRI